MFKDTMKGLDRIFETDISAPKTVLVTGPPGSMKTTFIFSILSKYLAQTDEYSFYITLEQNEESLRESLTKAHIDIHPKMQIVDFTKIRQDRDVSQADFMGYIIKLLEHIKEQYKDQFKVFALDSLGALYSLIEEEEEMRIKVYDFVQLLNEMGLFSFIVMERSLDDVADLKGNEGFLADGIIYLGLDVRDGRVSRYIQVEKMRSCIHSMERFGVQVGETGMEILRPMFDQ